MERKRRLPARASARVEQLTKKRNVTPRERTKTPTPSEPVKEETPPPSPTPLLPSSIQHGQPLPSVDVAQPPNLSSKDYKSLVESGVLSESLSRSRHKWISEGLFEKYWTKPHKRKGVLIEDPKNPAKDTMSKVGAVTIVIEPHIIEATMFTVKVPKPKPIPPLENSHIQEATPQPAPHPTRPVLQYGPTNGSMPSQMTSSGLPAIAANPPSAVGTPAGAHLVAAQPSIVPATQPQAFQQASTPATFSHGPPQPQANFQPPAPVAQQTPSTSLSTPSTTGTTGTTTASQPPIAVPLPPASSATPAGAKGVPKPSTNATSQQTPQQPGQPQPPAKVSAPSATRTVTPHAAAPAAKPAANDPVIALLAQKASGDPELRDLMKRVAVGQAKDGELAHFQKIIDQLNAEYKRKGGQQGPSADRLLVDGRTVKYFADEVRTILDIVLTSNPNQKSSELRPPPRSDPLVVLLVKTALEDQRTKDMIKRIAEGKPGFTDATDLKDILDRLHRDAKTVPQGLPATVPQQQPQVHTPQVQPQQQQPMMQAYQNGVQPGPKGVLQQHTHYANQQNIRSKVPLPPLNRPEISAVVFDFGTGDRYMFPKYSILEFLPTTSGQQVVASFLIVRKGSVSEYGGDPNLDYYQPVTIRLQTSSGRHLENLARVVAPQDEVRRYMDDVMDHMTRAEYVLLAMRLPRETGNIDSDDDTQDRTDGVSIDSQDGQLDYNETSTLPVLWTVDATNASHSNTTPRILQKVDPEEAAQQKYLKLVQSVAEKDIGYV